MHVIFEVEEILTEFLLFKLTISLIEPFLKGKVDNDNENTIKIS